MHSPKEMAAWIKARRQELGLSMDELAGISGVSHNSISYIESGGRIPSCGRIATLCRSLGYRMMLNAGGKTEEISTDFVRGQLRKELKHCKRTCEELGEIIGVSGSMTLKYSSQKYSMPQGFRYSTACKVAKGLGWTATLEKIKGFKPGKPAEAGRRESKFRGRDLGKPSEEIRIDHRGNSFIDAQCARNRKLRKGWAIDHDAAKAKELGLSYGMYIQYRDTGYLPRYLEQRKAEAARDAEATMIIESGLIGGR